MKPEACSGLCCGPKQLGPLEMGLDACHLMLAFSGSWACPPDSARLIVAADSDGAQSSESDLGEVAPADGVDFMRPSISPPLCQRPSLLPGKIDQV